MTPLTGDDGGLFEAAPYRAGKDRNLLDELADIEARNASSDDPAPQSDPWQVVGLDPETIPTWQAVMHEIVPSQVANPDRHQGLHEPYRIAANWSEEDCAQAAARWHHAGFTPEDAKQWTHAIDIHHEWQQGADAAERWRSRGFTPDEARPWAQGAVSPAQGPDFSQIFRDAAWHPYHLWALQLFAVAGDDGDAERRAWARLPIEHALACARAGLSPSEAEQLQDEEDKQALDAYLERRFDDRPEIDIYLAMLFNPLHRAVGAGHRR